MVVLQIGLDGIRMLDPSTGRTLRIYPLDSLTRWEVSWPTCSYEDYICIFVQHKFVTVFIFMFVCPAYLGFGCIYICILGEDISGC